MEYKKLNYKREFDAVLFNFEELKKKEQYNQFSLIIVVSLKLQKCTLGWWICI